MKQASRVLHGTSRLHKREQLDPVSKLQVGTVAATLTEFAILASLEVASERSPALTCLIALASTSFIARHHDVSILQVSTWFFTTEVRAHSHR